MDASWVCLHESKIQGGHRTPKKVAFSSITKENLEEETVKTSGDGLWPGP